MPGIRAHDWRGGLLEKTCEVVADQSQEDYDHLYKLVLVGAVALDITLFVHVFKFWHGLQDATVGKTHILPTSRNSTPPQIGL